MHTYYAVDDGHDERPFDEADMRAIEAQAQRRGITVDQLTEEAGVVRGPDGGLEWRDPQPGEHAGLRYAYDERDIFRTEDPPAIELGNRAAEGLVLENGTDDCGREQAQGFIRADASLAQIEAMGRESDRQMAEIEQRPADSDRWLAAQGLEPGE
jgi:hypothetical protein